MFAAELLIRKQEAQNYANFIYFLESSNHFSNTTEFHFDKIMIQTTIKASIIILLYNAIESTITKCLYKIHEVLKANHLLYDQCNKHLKKTIMVYYKYAEDKCENTHESVTFSMAALDFVRGIAPFSLSYEEMSRYYPLYSGNLDSLAIKKIFKKYGITFHEKASELQTIKTLRNKLAHGEASFEEVGREISSQQIGKLIEKTFEYLEKATQKVKEYLGQEEYLESPFRNPRLPRGSV